MLILMATGNRNKVREIQVILDTVFPGDYHLVTPTEITPLNISVEENGDTLEENAYLKSSILHKLTGLATIADDTGLEIDALEGKPGVYSARYAGNSANDTLNRIKVLNEMSSIPTDKRTARFRTIICFVDKKQTKYFEGICEGTIIKSERGSGGFGYDSIFMPAGSLKTFAEMSPEEKNSVSHRGKAIRNFIEFLKADISMTIAE